MIAAAQPTHPFSAGSTTTKRSPVEESVGSVAGINTSHQRMNGFLPCAARRRRHATSPFSSLLRTQSNRNCVGERPERDFFV